jgi:hypothetical protein
MPKRRLGGDSLVYTGRGKRVRPSRPARFGVSKQRVYRRLRRRYARKKYVKKAVKGTPAYAVSLLRKMGPEVKHAPVIENYTYSRNAYTSGGTYYPPKVNIFGLPMLSQITQGPGQHQRNGNRIIISQWMLDVFINLTRDATEPQQDGGTTTPSTGTYTRPTHITLFLGTTKSSGRTDTEIASDKFQEFWQSGNESRPLTGMRGDSTLKINTDTWTIIRKIHCELIPATSGQYAYEDPKNYPTEFRCKINLAKYMPSIINYEDDNVNPPNGKNLFVFFDMWPVGTLTDQGTTVLGTPLEVRTEFVERMQYIDP